MTFMADYYFYHAISLGGLYETKLKVDYIYRKVKKIIIYIYY